MSEENSSDSMLLPPRTVEIKGLGKVVLPRLYAKDAYRRMSGAEQAAAISQIVEDTAAEIQEVQSKAYRGPLERNHVIGWLLVRALRDAHCVREGGPQGTGLVKRIAMRCGLNCRMAYAYKKSNLTFGTAHLEALLQCKMPWHLTFKTLNFVGHGPGVEDRLQELLVQIPCDSSRVSRKKYAAWLALKQRERSAPAPEVAPSPAGEPPVVTDPALATG